MTNHIPRWRREEFSSFIKDRTTIEFPVLEDLIDYVKDNLSPEEVFDENDLEGWAEKHGFRKDDQ